MTAGALKMKTYDGNGNEIASQDSEGVNGSVDGQEAIDDAISVFNEITTDSNDSGNGISEKLDHENEEQDLNQADAQSNTDSQGQAEEVDPWASVPEDLRNQHFALKNNYQSLEQNHRANSGRVSALTKQLNQYKKGVADNEQAGGDTHAGAPTSDDLKGKSFDEIKEEWPEIAEFVEAQVNQVEKRMSQRIDPLQQRTESQDHQQYINSQLNALQQAHPDYQEVSADPQFQQWVAVQGPSVHAMAQSDEADANINLLNLYKAQRQAPAATQTPATPKRKPNKPTLADHAELPRKGASKAAADTDDVDPVDFFNKITSN